MLPETFIQHELQALTVSTKYSVLSNLKNAILLSLVCFYYALVFLLKLPAWLWNQLKALISKK